MARRPLRLLHTSDVHLGSHGYHGAATHHKHCVCPLRAVDTIAREHGVDGVLVVGDLFDHARVDETLVGRAFAGDPDVLQDRAKALGLDVEVTCIAASAPKAHTPGVMQVCPFEVAKPVVPGRLDSANAPYVLRTLDFAIEGCREIGRAHV